RAKLCGRLHGAVLGVERGAARKASGRQKSESASRESKIENGLLQSGNPRRGVCLPGMGQAVNPKATQEAFTMLPGGSVPRPLQHEERRQLEPAVGLTRRAN